jgi:dihydrofolate reductase
MGRKTYEQVLTFGEYPYKEKKTYIFTKNSSFRANNNAEFIATDVKNFVDGLRQVDGKNIWLVGGSLLIRDFISKNFIDNLILAIHPIILGEGIPLFAHPINATSLKLTGCQSYSSGLVQLSYNVMN